MTTNELRHLDLGSMTRRNCVIDSADHETRVTYADITARAQEIVDRMALSVSVSHAWPVTEGVARLNAERLEELATELRRYEA